MQLTQEELKVKLQEMSEERKTPIIAKVTWRTDPSVRPSMGETDVKQLPLPSHSPQNPPTLSG